MSNGYVKITGINGSATDPSHIGWIEISQVFLPIQAPRPQGEFFGGTRRSLDSFSFNKEVDETSPAFYQAVAKNTRFSEAKLDITKLDEDTKTERKLLEARFENVQVIGVRHRTRDSLDAGARSNDVDEYEAITIQYGKVSTKRFSAPAHDDKW